MRLAMHRESPSRPSDISVYKKTHYNQMVKLWRVCVVEFVKAATNAMAANIDTGMSVASFSPVAARVRYASKLRSIIGKGSGAKPGYSSTDFPGLTRFKSRAHGEKLGQKAYELDFGNPNNPKMVFEFRIVVLQHHLHESQRNRWESLQKGKEAFIETWNRLLPDYIHARDINKWIITGVYDARQ